MTGSPEIKENVQFTIGTHIKIDTHLSCLFTIDPIAFYNTYTSYLVTNV